MRLRALSLAAVLALAFGAGATAQVTSPPATETEKPALELSVAQQQLIFTSISSKTHKSTAAPPNFLPTVGVVVPAGVELLPIPDAVLEVVPKLRGYVCALVANQALIVDVQSRKIVAVIGGGNEPKAPSPS